MRHGFTRYSATIDSMEAELILILSGNYIGSTAEFSLIVKNGRSREPLIQAFREEIDAAFGLVDKLGKAQNPVKQ